MVAIEGEYDPLGYIDGNRFYLFDVTASERDENGYASKFSKFQEEDLIGTKR